MGSIRGTDPIAPYDPEYKNPYPFRRWAIGLMATSVVIGAVASLALANYTSATPPVPVLAGTTLGRAVIGVSMAGSIVFGLAAGICATKFKNRRKENSENARLNELKFLCKTGESIHLIGKMNELRSRIHEHLKPEARRTLHFPTSSCSNLLYGDLLTEENGMTAQDRLPIVQQFLAEYYKVHKAYIKRFGSGTA